MCWGYVSGYVKIFESRGARMGASNPHPNGQIWASRSVPNEVVAELSGQREYFQNNGKVLLCEYGEMEESLGERVVARNASFLAVVPFWAVWPFGVIVLPRRQVARLQALTETHRPDSPPICRRVMGVAGLVKEGGGGGWLREGNLWS